MATRVRIAAGACVMVSGLLISGLGAALAIADPDAAQNGESGIAQAGPADAGTPDHPPGLSPAEGTAVGSAAPAGSSEATATAPRPTSQVGDGRGGSTSDGADATRSSVPVSKQNSPDGVSASHTDPSVAARRAAADPPVQTTTQTTSETTTAAAPPPAQPVTGALDPDDPEQHPGWQWWPWCWPLPPAPGVSPGTGNGGGVGAGRPPIGVGIPKPPPLMQLPAPSIPGVVPPTLPVISVDPVVDAITGLATAAAQLPFAPLTVPAIVAPFGAGAGSGGAGAAGGAGGAPRPGGAPAPRAPGGSAGRNQPAQAKEQNPPPAFGASNRVMPATYRAGYGEYLRSAGVGEMAAVAVPGVTGILLLTAGGGLVGFRQARAGRAGRANSTARFMD